MAICRGCGSEIPPLADKIYFRVAEMRYLKNGNLDIERDMYHLCDRCYGDILEVMKKREGSANDTNYRKTI